MPLCLHSTSCLARNSDSGWLQCSQSLSQFLDIHASFENDALNIGALQCRPAPPRQRTWCFFDSGCRGVVRVQARIILHHGEVKRPGHQQTFQSFTPPMLDPKNRLLIALIAQDVRAREAAMPRVSSQTQEWTCFGIIVQCLRLGLGLGWWWWWWCFLRLMLLIVAMAVASLQMHRCSCRFGREWFRCQMYRGYLLPT